MPSAKVTAALSFGGLIVGIMLGAHSTVPDVKVVSVPKVETRVVEHTTTVTTPLPESCLKAVELLMKASDNSGSQTDAAGSILLALSDLGRAGVEGDVKAVNQAITVIRREKDRLDTAALTTTEAQLKVTSAVRQCEADVAR